MTAGKIERLFVSLQTTHHEAPFERAGNQGGQFRGIDIGVDLPSALALLGNQLQAIKPRTESSPSFRSQLRITIVGVDGRVQQRAPSRHQRRASVAKVPNDLLQTVNSIWDLLCSFEARIHCDFPSVVEGVCRKRLFALKVPVDSAFF